MREAVWKNMVLWGELPRVYLNQEPQLVARLTVAYVYVYKPPDNYMTSRRKSTSRKIKS